MLNGCVRVVFKDAFGHGEENEEEGKAGRKNKNEQWGDDEDEAAGKATLR